MRTASPTPRARASARREAARRAFTVVELMVVTVIIMVLASLTLSGLAVVRQRARIARTKSTIRKLHEIVVPHYESYLRRRVPFASGTNARTNALNRLVNVRTLTLREMPDSRDDVCVSGSAVLNLSTFLRTGPVLAYARTRETVTTWQATHESAECLHMIVSRGGLEPDVMEQFRGDEIGDADGDQCPEFLDAWNQPIIFLRWAPGFSSPLSPVQVANATTHHDPFDPQRVDAAGYALVPLIVSGGPDRRTGLLVTGSGWSGLSMNSIVTSGSLVTSGSNFGAPVSATDHRDNITNHDLSAR